MSDKLVFRRFYRQQHKSWTSSFPCECCKGRIACSLRGFFSTLSIIIASSFFVGLCSPQGWGGRETTLSRCRPGDGDLLEGLHLLHRPVKNRAPGKPDSEGMRSIYPSINASATRPGVLNLNSMEGLTISKFWDGVAWAEVQVPLGKVN